MKRPLLVCPHEPALFDRLAHESLVVRTSDVSQAPLIKRQVENRNRLHCVQVVSPEPLARLGFTADMKGIPMAVWVPTVGGLAAFFEALPLLQTLSVQVYLPTSEPGSLRDARIIASCGIACALVMEDAPQDWEGLEDLLVYTAYGKVRHGPIEPFSFVIKHDRKGEPVDYGVVYFDGPQRYLHLDAEGRVALDAKDARDGVFVGTVDDIDAVAEHPRHKERLARSDAFFLKTDGCAFCAGFRACQGKFSAQRAGGPGCEKLFGKLVEIADAVKSRDGVELWQP
jgi:hypothetical protein